ncbi:SusC/RagA family TonB-linked outer membrane protein [Flavobacterium sp. N3904]|uniref:SusC/RagA family TonB-linked outer membrane protein n=1 Tax=Flavobacterium sp. N3904 TaxID=2986835 RepID=UPI0022240E5C|nr:TonB-dependent receptor [Flavobacterium sp. N3904]
MKKLLSDLIHWKVNHRKVPLMFLLLACGFINAQNKVQGTVTDVNGLGLPGVNISVVGASKGVSSDFDGKYSIDVPANATLSFSFIGFQTQKMPVKGNSKINITLVATSETLKEIVVIGYGTQRRKDVNSAISSIKGKDLDDVKLSSVDQMLQGRVSGVSISNNSGTPGGAASVRVRGTTSLNGTNEPLYIIDGVPVSGDATNKASSGRPIAGTDFTSMGNIAVSPLSMINPNDIESIDVLKDASATSIYGARGANGVIIITTKSGKKGTGKISFDTYTSAQTNTKKLDVMNLQQYARQQNALGTAFGNQTLRPEFSHPELLGPGTDWQDEVFRTGIANSYQLSFSKSKDDTSYYLSGGYLSNQSTIIGTYYHKYNVRLNVDSKVKSWMKVGANVNGSFSDENVTVNSNYNGIISNTLLQAPDIAVSNTDGTYAGPPDSSQNVAYFNPVAEALTTTNTLTRKNFLGNAYAEISFTDHLRYRAEIGGNTEYSQNDLYNPEHHWGAYNKDEANLDIRRQSWYSVNIKNMLTYDNQFGKSKLNVLLAQESNDSHWEGTIASAKGFLANDPHTINLANPKNSTVTGYQGSQALLSYFARAIYEFDNRYSMTASYRADGSSKFDPTTKNQWGYFPSIAVGWKLSNEAFMETTKKYIDDIKFRIGYGETGNQQIPNNRYSAMLTTQNSGLGSGFLVANSPNPDLKWESLQQTDLGLDFTMFDAKLNFTIDLYQKKSKDFLFQVPLPLYLTGGGYQYGGIDAPYSNLGSMQNRGYDLTLGYNLVSGDSFSWNTAVNVSQYKNEILEIQDGLIVTAEVNTNGYIPYTVTNSVVGHPMGMFWGYKTDGLFQTQAQLDSAPLQFGQAVGTAPGETGLGDVKYVDVNGDGVVNADDKTFIGNPHPTVTYGFTNTFKYKNFDCSLFLQGVYGNDVLNLTRRNGIMNSNLYTNQLVEAANFWTPTNTNTNIPRPEGNSNSNNLQISDRFIESGSYLRVQNFTFGYTLPSDVMSKLTISKLRLYLTGQNLFTFTNYSGYDPEVGSINQNTLLSGIDNGRFPSARTVLMGVNVEF